MKKAPKLKTERSKSVLDNKEAKTRIYKILAALAKEVAKANKWETK